MASPIGQGAYQPATYGQPASEHGQGQGGPVPTGGWPYPESKPPPARKSRRGLIIVLIAVAVLVVVGIGGYVGWSLTNDTSQFTVGACVKQDGSSAVVVECGTDGAYEITSIVETEGGCPDADQPSLVLSELGGKKYACLAPATEG
jgi:hypothetical protein